MATELTQEYVKSLFDYHEDGYLVWKVKKAQCVKIGTRAGGIKTNGRLFVNINGKILYTSRIIFLYHNGYLPIKVDHSDRDIKNEKVNNLRAASVSNNSANRCSAKNSTSPYLGVIHNKKRNKFEVQIRKNKKPIWVGRFKDEAQAALAYNRVAVMYHGEFANLNIIQRKLISNA